MSWFCYSTPSICKEGNVLTINYCDGRGSVDYCFDSDEWGFVSDNGDYIDAEDIDCSSNQSYNSQWTVGSENYYTISYFGKSYQVSFEIKENPVESISFTLAEPIALVEGVNGRYENHLVWDEETDDEYVDGQWFLYNTPSIYRNGNIITVNYNDDRGSVEYYYSDEGAFVSKDGDYIASDYFNCSSNQSYDNQWTVGGENYLTVSYFGKSCQVPVEVKENPVESISFTPAEPIVLTEEIDGNWTYEWVWNEATEEDIEVLWFCYDTPSIYRSGNTITVNYSDDRGSVDYCFDSDEGAFVSRDGDYIDLDYINYSSNQSYNSQWTVGGENHLTVSYFGKSCQVSFEIKENPVDSISFTSAQPYIITEETNGYLEKHWACDEETGNEYVDGEWFCYYTPSIYEDGNVLTVNYNDGRGSVDYCFDTSKWAFISAEGDEIKTDKINTFINQSYDNRLYLGDHSFTLSYNGKECKVSFTIVKNPVESISFTPAQLIVLTEGIDGYYQKHWVWDEETETEYVDEEWFCYYTPSIYEEGNILTVNYNDGRGSVDYTYSRINDTDWIWAFVSKDGDTISQNYIESDLIQSFENRLPIGENSFSLSYMGRKCEVSFTTVKNPVDSIYFTPAMPLTLIEGFDGFYQENWVYDEETGNEYVDGEWFRYYTPPIYREGNKLTVNYNDGRGSVDYVCVFDRSNYGYIYSNDEYGELSNDINTYLEQSYDNQLSLGENTLYLKYMNRVCEVPFTIIENPVESISFTPANPIIFNLNENGYYETHFAWDEEKEETYVDGEWFCYYTPSIYEEGNILTVNYNDGRGSVEYICQYDEDEDWHLYVNSEHGELKYYIDVYLEQSYENQLSVGENIFTIRILNKECNVPFLIVDPDAVCKHENLYDAVVENRVDATCKEPGRYDEVIYCKDCEEEVSRVEKQLEKLPHTEKTVNAKAASCTESGYTGDVVCSVCNEVISKGTVIAKLAHKKVVDKAVAATCTKTGLTEGSHCSVCGTVIKKQTTVAKKAHTYKNVITKADATKKKSGKITPTCSVCGAKGKANTIAYPKTATLKFTSATYTGKAIKPSVTVKDSKGKTISSKYYTVSYKNNKNVGKATVTITFKGNYTGKITKTFTINPKGTSISKLSAKSKGFTATWKKQATQTTGYEIQYSTSSKFTSKITKTIKVTSAKTVSKTVSKLKASSKYYVRVRTYKTVSKTNYYSAWSKALSVKTKK